VDVGPDGRLAFFAPNGKLQVQGPGKDQGQEVSSARGGESGVGPLKAAGLWPRWSPDGRRVAYSIPTGLWITDLQTPPRQVFSGWVVRHAWAGNDELIVAEGKPNLKATLWRVRSDGSTRSRITSVDLIYSYWNPLPDLQFDVHPDRRRLVVAALELHDADISMIENIQ